MLTTRNGRNKIEIKNKNVPSVTVTVWWINLRFAPKVTRNKSVAGWLGPFGVMVSRQRKAGGIHVFERLWWVRPGAIVVIVGGNAVALEDKNTANITFTFFRYLIW